MTGRRQHTARGPQEADTLDAVIPVPHFSERHQRRIAAPPEAVWEALHALRSRDLPLTRALMAVRTLPERLSGRRPTGQTLDGLENGPVPVLAAAPPRRILAAGLMQPWRLRGGEQPPALDPNALRAFDEPGWVKCGVDFVIEPAADATVLRTETRVQATDAVTRARFALYWLIIRAGSGLIRREMLRSVARAAERASPGSG